MGPFGVVVQLKGNAWCMLIHSLGVWKNLDTKAFSADLETCVLAYSAEDISGVESVILCQNGHSIREYVSADQAEYQDELDELFTETAAELGCELKSPPALERVIVCDYANVFSEFGVAFVEPYPLNNKTVMIPKDQIESIRVVPQ